MKILDEMLSSRLNVFTIQEMTEKVNEIFEGIELPPVTTRCVEKDLQFMTGNYSPFPCVDLEIRYKTCTFYDEVGKSFTRSVKAYRYKEPGYSIFKREWTIEEKQIMDVVFRMLGQFDGLPQFDQLENIRLAYKPEGEYPIVQITRNPLGDSNLFGKLFSFISEKVSVEMTYHTFVKPAEKIKKSVYPYLLKEYNRRWFLMYAETDTKKICHLGLERIDSVEALPELQYEEYEDNWDEDYFGDIIGVTNTDGKPQKILFWVDDKQKEYIKTKPIHDSQTLLKDDANEREKYPSLKRGDFFTIECKRNYELTRELCSFGSSLIVLSPDEVREDVKKWITSMYEKYNG